MEANINRYFRVCVLSGFVIAIAAVLVKCIGIYFRRYLESTIQEGFSHSILAQFVTVAMLVDAVFYVLLVTAIIVFALSFIIRKGYSANSNS